MLWKQLKLIEILLLCDNLTIVLPIVVGKVSFTEAIGLTKVILAKPLTIIS